LRALASEASGHRGDSKVQPAPVPIIGDLSSGTPAGFAPMVAAFHRGLNEAGHIQGRNFTIEFRRSEGQDERLPAFAADLVHRQVAVIAATGGSARERFTSSPIRSSPVGSDDWSR
jgi:putative tryptophan/tyrosine transport system substrate-binding protein